jgi:hypothetical protein
MKSLIGMAALAALLCSSTLVQAAPEDPVRKLMDLALGNWAETPAEGQDYFNENYLGTLYSKAFVAAYREAAKYPVYDEGSGPFGYDVITNGQDGCPLKDITVSPAVAKDGYSDVKVTFKLWTCVEDGSIDKNIISEVHFDVVNEDGKDLVSDIHRVTDGQQDSLMQEMADIAKNGAAAPAEEGQE